MDPVMIRRWRYYRISLCGGNEDHVQDDYFVIGGLPARYLVKEEAVARTIIRRCYQGFVLFRGKVQLSASYSVACWGLAVLREEGSSWP